MFNTKHRGPSVTGLVEFPLWGQRWPSVEVAGESHRSAEIGALFSAPVPEDGVEGTFTAHLVPEPANRYDRNAVQVVVNGNLVGYLPKEEAGRYQPALLALGDNGLTATVEARVWVRPEIDDDYDRHGNLVTRRTGRLHARVTLALAQPHLILPLNGTPGGVEVPTGRAVKLGQIASGAEACAPWLRAEGEGWVHVTLHRVEEVLARSTRELVEARIDGVPAGRMTPAMSLNFLPLIDQLEARGLGCAARGIVKGNRIKAEVSIFAAKASEISAAWLDEHVYAVPVRRIVPTAPVESSTVTVQAPPPASEEAGPDNSRPAGWYEDPEGMAPYRYWDGSSWTARIKMR